MIGNLPTEHTKSPWAFVIVLLVIILFGWFWYMESSKLKNGSDSSIEIATPASEKRVQPLVNDEFDISTLEANAVNIAIPSFEELF